MRKYYLCHNHLMIKTTICVDIYGNRFDIATDSLTWRPAVYGIVIKDSEVLLSKQFGNKYGLPGGGLKLGEIPEDGVIREIKEETGIDVINPKITGLENSFFKSSHSIDNNAYHSLLIYYICEYSGGQLSTSGFDKDERINSELAEWINVDDIDSLELASTVDFRPYIKKHILTN